MAVTSVWPIRGRMDTLIQYVMNPEKTVDWEASAVLHSIDNVLQYAIPSKATPAMPVRRKAILLGTMRSLGMVSLLIDP